MVQVPQATKSFKGLQPPILYQTDKLVMGAEMDKLRLQNRRQHHALQDHQLPTCCGLPTRDRPPSRLGRSNHLSIAMTCAQLALQRRIQQKNYCQRGHNWDAQQKQANHGQKRRCGKQWLDGPTNHPNCLKYSRISQWKAPRK